VINGAAFNPFSVEKLRICISERGICIRERERESERAKCVLPNSDSQKERGNQCVLPGDRNWGEDFYRENVHLRELQNNSKAVHSFIMSCPPFAQCSDAFVVRVDWRRWGRSGGFVLVLTDRVETGAVLAAQISIVLSRDTNAKGRVPNEHEVDQNEDQCHVVQFLLHCLLIVARDVFAEEDPIDGDNPSVDHSLSAGKVEEERGGAEEADDQKADLLDESGQGEAGLLASLRTNQHSTRGEQSDEPEREDEDHNEIFEL